MGWSLDSRETFLFIESMSDLEIPSLRLGLARLDNQLGWTNQRPWNPAQAGVWTAARLVRPRELPTSRFSIVQ